MHSLQDIINKLLKGLQNFRFWYVSLVSCRRNPVTCEWEHVSDMDTDIFYDLYLLNGNPEGKVKSIVKQHFSYDNQVFASFEQ